MAHLLPEARLAVRGRCMEPALRDGETVVLAPAAARPPRFGDVVLARLPEGLRLERPETPQAFLAGVAARAGASPRAAGW